MNYFIGFFRIKKTGKMQARRIPIRYDFPSQPRNLTDILSTGDYEQYAHVIYDPLNGKVLKNRGGSLTVTISQLHFIYNLKPRPRKYITQAEL